MDKRLFEKIKKNIVLRMDIFQNTEISDNVDLDFMEIPFKIEEVCEFEADGVKTGQHYLRVTVPNCKIAYEFDNSSGIAIRKTLVTINGEEKLCAFIGFFNLKENFLGSGRLLYQHEYREVDDTIFSVFYPYKEVLTVDENKNVIYITHSMSEEEMKRIKEKDIALVCAFPKAKE